MQVSTEDNDIWTSGPFEHLGMAEDGFLSFWLAGWLPGRGRGGEDSCEVAFLNDLIVIYSKPPIA